MVRCRFTNARGAVPGSRRPVVCPRQPRPPPHRSSPARRSTRRRPSSPGSSFASFRSSVIVLFWMVHVLPEKIAEKRHHPQKDAIHTLCLLSLAFGGLLWPIAWLWAYTKPVGYRLAYGTEKHDDYYLEMGEKAKSGELLQEDIVHLRHELDAMAAKGTLPRDAQGAAQRARRAAGSSPRSARRQEARNGHSAARNLRVLRLADLHQVQVAAVEHDLASHRRHHPDRRAGGDDPDAQCGRTLLERRAGHQIRRADHSAGEGTRHRGARRAQPAGQEGRAVVPHRPDAVSERAQHRQGQACRGRGQARAGRRQPGRRVRGRARIARAAQIRQRTSRGTAAANRPRTNAGQTES